MKRFRHTETKRVSIKAFKALINIQCGDADVDSMNILNGKSSDHMNNTKIVNIHADTTIIHASSVGFTDSCYLSAAIANDVSGQGARGKNNSGIGVLLGILRLRHYATSYMLAPVKSIFYGKTPNISLVALVDNVCKLVVKVSIDMAFSRNSMMRYMGFSRLINPYLKDEWVNEVPNINSIREKILYSITRYADAQNLKKRRENVTFPTLTERFLAYSRTKLSLQRNGFLE